MIASSCASSPHHGVCDAIADDGPAPPESLLPSAFGPSARLLCDGWVRSLRCRTPVERALPTRGPGRGRQPAHRVRASAAVVTWRRASPGIGATVWKSIHQPKFAFRAISAAPRASEPVAMGNCLGQCFRPAASEGLLQAEQAAELESLRAELHRSVATVAELKARIRPLTCASCAGAALIPRMF